MGPVSRCVSLLELGVDRVSVVLVSVYERLVRTPLGKFTALCLVRLGFVRSDMLTLRA